MAQQAIPSSSGAQLEPQAKTYAKSYAEFPE